MTIGMGAKRNQGAPSWMVTFADLMALLTTFFILLLSMSEIDAQKYRAISGALREAFSSGYNLVQRNTQPASGNAPPAVIELPPTPMPERQPSAAPDPTAEAAQNLERFTEGLKGDIAQGLVEVSRNHEGQLQISFRHEAAFESGSADLRPGFVPVIERIGHLITTTRGQVIIAGHTDDRPINTPRFRSNWDLSAARAVSVVHSLLDRRLVDEQRLRVEGFADTRPLVPNTDDLNRARNRRVEIRILDSVTSEPVS